MGREYAMVSCEEYDSLIDSANKLSDENAKLRELVRDMFGYAANREMELCDACLQSGGEYADCSARNDYDGACGLAKKLFEELFADSVSELGVEV